MRAAIKLRQPDHLPVVFSESFITGIHCSMGGALRRHDKLESRPVKICEPYQMLGLVENDLKDATGIDTTPIFPNRAIFGFVNEDWKPWRTPWGQNVLVSGQLQVDEKPDGTYTHPQADRSAPHSAHMPKTGYFFDSIVRQEEFDEDNLKVEDNLEEFGPMKPAEEAYWREQAELFRGSDRAVVTHLNGTALGDIALAAGLEAWEPFLPEESCVPMWQDLIAKHGLQMPSAYLGGILHEGDAQQIVENAVAQAAAAKPLGVRIVVSNPNPIAWGSPEDKSDSQLRFQADVLKKIGAGLKAQGQRLAYHTHDPEMRCGAREFTHMMRAVEPELMGFCFDVDWIYRGCGTSQVAVEDIMGMYGHRIVSLHLRQSHGGIWTEYLPESDIDHSPVWQFLKIQGFDGPAIIETAFEEGTPRALPMQESHGMSHEWIESCWRKATRCQPGHRASASQ
jgi:inosose dehydratase